MGLRRQGFSCGFLVVMFLSNIMVCLAGVHDFQIMPTPLNVSVEQGTATFHCQNTLVDGINWRINGTLENLVISADISTRVISGSGGSMYIMLIDTLLRYNQTSVECVATFFDGSPPIITSPVKLLIQDTPDRVVNAFLERNCSSNSLTTQWEPLFSLDLTNIDPDILYTVELFTITCGQNISISHRVVSTNSASVENIDQLQIYKAIIAARNNVIGAHNGPSVETKEVFMSLDEPALYKLARNLQFNMTSYNPVPSYYTMVLNSLDGVTTLVVNITVERNGGLISMRVQEPLPVNTLWNVSVLAYGCEEDIVVTGLELSTYNIQNISVSSSHSSEIRVTGFIVDEAIDTGVLVIIYSLTDDHDVQYVVQHTDQMIDITVAVLSETQYGVSVFVLGNGFPFPGVAAFPTVLFVEFQEVPQPSGHGINIEYELHPTSTGICISCTFLDPFITDCVAVVHQRISQLSSSGLMKNIESSHKFNRSGDTAYGCIKGVNLTYYQIGIIGGKEKNPTKHRNIAHEDPHYSVCGIICIASSITAIMAILLILVVFVCLAMIFFIKRCHKSVKASSTEVELELHKCNAYEVVELSQQRAQMEDNPAYGKVGQFS